MYGCKVHSVVYVPVVWCTALYGVLVFSVLYTKCCLCRAVEAVARAHEEQVELEEDAVRTTRC